MDFHAEYLYKQKNVQMFCETPPICKWTVVSF